MEAAGCNVACWLKLLGPNRQGSGAYLGYFHLPVARRLAMWIRSLD